MDDVEGNHELEYTEILEDLKLQAKEAQSILDILNPLIENGEYYKKVFEDIRLGIDTSHKAISSSKSLNTKYSKDLDKTKTQIEEFLEATTEKQIDIKKLINSIKALEQKAQTRFLVIETLKSDANTSKKLITEAKNDAKTLIKSIQKLKDESLDKIKELREGRKESKRIQAFLKIKEKEVQKLFEKIKIKHAELFSVQPGLKKSKVEELDENIKNINSFNTLLNSEVKPGLEKKTQFLDEVEKDIKTKEKEISALLSDATAKTLAEGYLESMEGYSRKKCKKHTKITVNKRVFISLLKNLHVLLFNKIIRNTGIVVNYCIFIVPIAIIIWLFQDYDFVSKVLADLAKSGVTFSLKEIILLKTAISIPLLWIAWFGQRNISQRKRLFEEYNHKLRVVQMYLLFNSKEQSYELSEIKELEEVLVKTIGNNPAEYLGRGETMIDNLLEKFRIKGFQKSLKDELIIEFKPIIKSLINNEFNDE